VVGDEAVDELRDLARELRGARVLELSSTAQGGGVAELLSSLLPLQVDLGIEAQWQVVAGEPGFFEVTTAEQGARAEEAVQEASEPALTAG